MKPTLRTIARVFVELCRGLPEEHLPDACDAALELLTKLGLGRVMRTFPRVVREELLRQENTAVVTMSSPAGQLGHSRDVLANALEHVLKKNMEVEEHADPDLIGGLRLQVGDERFDASVRGALNQFASALSS